MDAGTIIARARNGEEAQRMLKKHGHPPITCNQCGQEHTVFAANGQACCPCTPFGRELLTYINEQKSNRCC